jgi:hypothetical protein
MYAIQPKKRDTLSFTVRVDMWKLATGHGHLPRGGVHKDRRRPARGNARSAFRRTLAD